MTLLEQWRIKAYGNELDERSRDQLWNDYFAVEKGIYERILKDPSKVYEGTVDELAKEFGTDQQTMVGFLDGINETVHFICNIFKDFDIIFFIISSFRSMC